ncbi:MAG: DUF4375 domain-containing protein [Anaeroplasma sp.]
MKNKLSLIAFGITLIGGCGVGINIILSEILYQHIDELTKTPICYQVFVYISIFVTIVGIILSAIYRNKSNTKKIEERIEVPLMIIGFILMIGLALTKHKLYILDILICVGSLLFIVGFSCFISTKIGLHRNYIIDIKTPSMEEIWKKTNINDFAVSIFLYLMEKSSNDRLSKEEKAVLIVRTFVEEVYNGGFEQFMDNSSGKYFDELLESFEIINAQKLIEIYKDLINKFPIGLSNDEKEKTYDDIITENFENIRQCDLKMYEIEGSYFDEIIYNFVMENKNKFN